jgi:acyl-ACP thioesterase
MTMTKTIWEKQYEINTLLVNTQKKLDLYAILNLLQDIAWEHATHLDHGHEDLLKKKMIWVLTRQKLYIEQWPDLGETLKIVTWIRPQENVSVNRDFEIYVQNKKIGECTALWLTIDAETRKLAKSTLNSTNNNYYRDDYCLDLNASKIKLRDDLENLENFYVHYSDLDIHLHVNNTRYARWTLDSLSNMYQQPINIKEYEVNFLAETKLGDIITIQKIYNKSDSINTIQFQGLRESDKKIVFASIIKLK